MGSGVPSVRPAIAPIYEPAHSSRSGIETLRHCQDLIDGVVRHGDRFRGALEGFAENLLVDHAHRRTSWLALVSSIIEARSSASAARRRRASWSRDFTVPRRRPMAVAISGSLKSA